MAGKKLTEAGAEPTGKEIRLPAAGTMKAFASAAEAAAEAIDDARKELGESRDTAVKGHLLPKPFKLAQDLRDMVKSAKNESIAAEKLAQFLAHFDHYRKHFKLDELANLQGRLLPAGPIGEKDGDEEPPRETQEDGLPDDRPRHLRQPGASAADAVRDMANKAGVTPRPDEDNLGGVGRGPGKPH